MARMATRRIGVELGVLAGLAPASVVARALVVDAESGAVFGEASTFPITLGGTFLWFALGMALAVVSAWLAGRPEGLAPPRVVAFVARRPWVPWLGAAVCFVLVSRGIGITGDGFQRLGVAQVIGEHLLYAGV